MKRYYFRCENGHEVVSPTVLHQCPAFRHGRRCVALLRRYGPGSKKERAA